MRDTAVRVIPEGAEAVPQPQFFDVIELDMAVRVEELPLEERIALSERSWRVVRHEAYRRVIDAGKAEARARGFHVADNPPEEPTARPLERPLLDPRYRLVRVRLCGFADEYEATA